MPLLNVTPEEWAEASEFFNNPENKDVVKFRRKRKQAGQEDKDFKEGHSFLKVELAEGGYEVVALANRNVVGEEAFANIGEGAFGKVKVVQTKEGENLALKVEGKKPGKGKDLEYKIMKL